MGTDFDTSWTSMLPDASSEPSFFKKVCLSSVSSKFTTTSCYYDDLWISSIPSYSIIFFSGDESSSFEGEVGRAYSSLGFNSKAASCAFTPSGFWISWQLSSLTSSVSAMKIGSSWGFWEWGSWDYCSGQVCCRFNSRFELRGSGDCVSYINFEIWV